MAGSAENGGENGPGERLPAAPEPPQRLLEEQPRLGPQHREEQQEEEEEKTQRSEAGLEGVLDEATAAKGLHRLGCSAPGTEYVYLNLSLPGCDLTDITILSGFVHLQKLDLCNNKITDLSCVSHLPYLLHLKASHNHLHTCFGFKPPKNLKEADFSHNQIPQMEDLSSYQSLTTLLLDFNAIEEIKGLEKCPSLTHLSLSHNKLSAIRGLQNLPLKTLNLSFNQIEKVTGVETLKSLQELDLSSNKINSLQGLEGHDLLERINLEDNQIAELQELWWIQDLPLLRVLNLLKNPLQEQTGYWLSAIFLLLQLTELDLQKIPVEDKVAAVNKHDPPAEVVAAADHRTQVMRAMQQPQRVLPSTLPGLEVSYPILVLVGPVACGKRELAHKTCRQFNNLCRFGPCHTTRAAYFGEENRLDYYFISPEAFEEMVGTGKFVATYKYGGHHYGLGRDTLESNAREGLATCVHLEMEGVRSLKCTHFKPRYILVVPRDKGQYEEHLRRTGLFSRPEIEEALSRVDMYLQTSQELPGYFDALISMDDFDEAFAELSVLMKVYLGLELPEASDTLQDSSSTAGSRAQPLQEQRLSLPGLTQPSSVDEFRDFSRKNFPRALLDFLAAPPGSVTEASLQRRFCAAHQALSEKEPPPHVQVFPREEGAPPGASSAHQPFLKYTLQGRNVPQEQNLSLSNPESCGNGRKSKLQKAIMGESAPAAEGLQGSCPVPEEPKAEHQDPRRAGNAGDRLKGPIQCLAIPEFLCNLFCHSKVFPPVTSQHGLKFLVKTCREDPARPRQVLPCPSSSPIPGLSCLPSHPGEGASTTDGHQDLPH